MLHSLRQKYNSLSKPVLASLWFAFCSAMQKGISLLSTPIFTRLLTKEQYGVYSVFQSWYFILNIFVTLQLYLGVFNNGIINYSDDKDGFTSSMLGLSTTITSIMFVIYCLGQSFWNSIFGLSSIYMYAMFLEFLFVPAYNFWATSQRFEFKYIKLVIVTIIMSVASPVIGIVAVYLTDDKAAARVLSYVFVQIVIGGVIYYFIMRKGKRFFDFKYWKYGLSFNIPLVPHYLSTMILNQSDRIMIDKMIGTGEAAIYSVAYQVSMMMTIITKAINDSFVPFTYQELKSKRNERIMKNANGLLVIVGIGCMFAIAFGPEIIKIFADEEYYDAIWIIPPVATSVFFMFLYPLFANVEFFYEKKNFIALASIIAAVLNYILNYIFIPICGYYAAGYTTLVSYLAYSIAHLCVYKKIIKENFDNRPIYNLRFIAMFSLGMLVAMFLLTLTYNYYFIRYFIITIMVVLFIIFRKKIIGVIKSIRKKE